MKLIRNLTLAIGLCAVIVNGWSQVVSRLGGSMNDDGLASYENGASSIDGSDKGVVSGPSAFDVSSSSGVGRGSALLVDRPIAAGVSLPGSGVRESPIKGVAAQVFIPEQRLADYAANAASNVFGANLFTGAFAKVGPAIFNPDYVVEAGDSIRLRMWGGYDFDSLLTVDAQGAIFLPQCGPVHVAGTQNKDLQALLIGALRRVFSSKVSIYASLVAGQPVRVYVAGFVRHPGMYEGTNGDGVLKYLDMAGGIDPDRGTFLGIEIKRGKVSRSRVNLYHFLLSGEIDSSQLSSGDVIFVGPRQSVVTVSGLASNARLFEFSGQDTTLGQIITTARPDPRSTNVRVSRSRGAVESTEYYTIMDAAPVIIHSGDAVAFTSDKRPGTISVRVEGEHSGPQEFVLPYGTSLSQLMQKVIPSPRSDIVDLQLFRDGIREKQAKILAESLIKLQNSVLTARSGTNEEAQLRQREASLVLQWVDRARSIEPRGQLVVGSNALWTNVVLENGDVIRIPPKDGPVLIGGEVLFPNTLAYQPKHNLADYIRQAGGYTQNADSSRTIIAHLDGTFVDSRESDEIKPGDQIMVLPKVDFKTRQFAKDIFSMIYEIAIAARVAVGL